MSQRTQARRRQRTTTTARHDLAAELARAVIRHPGAWQTCRRCRALFRGTYWPECYLCWLTSHDTRPA